MNKSFFLSLTLAVAFVMTAILVGPPGTGKGPDHNPFPGIPPIGNPPQITHQFQQQVWETEIPATILTFNY